MISVALLRKIPWNRSESVNTAWNPCEKAQHSVHFAFLLLTKTKPVKSESASPPWSTATLFSYDEPIEKHKIKDDDYDTATHKRERNDKSVKISTYNSNECCSLIIMIFWAQMIQSAFSNDREKHKQNKTKTHQHISTT